MRLTLKPYEGAHQTLHSKWTKSHEPFEAKLGLRCNPSTIFWVPQVRLESFQVPRN